jgi:RNA polymerase sigma-70 factor (ECF subfamily)
MNETEKLQALDDDPAVPLLRGIIARDQTALAKLHSLLARRVHAFSLRITRDSDLASQVVTDTLWDVWKFPERYNGTCKVSTWVLAIAKHKAMHATRSRRAEFVDLDDVSDSLVSELGDPESSSLAGERAIALWRCVQELPEVQRECLHLVFYEGMTLAEVAQVQQVPENTVKTRLFHARKKLQVCLGDTLD